VNTSRGWIAVALVAVVSLVAFIVADRARAAVGRQRDEVAGRVQRFLDLRQENQRLRRALADIEAPAANDLNRARIDLAQLQKEIAEQSRALAVANGAPAARFTAGSIMPAADWRNAGNGTPEAALETVLWSSAGGDVDRLAANLRMSDRGRAAIENAFSALSAEERAKYGTPERLLAALTSAEVPLATVRVHSWDYRNSEQTQKSVTLEEYTGADPKIVSLLFQRESTGWTLRVPDDVVTRYVAQFKHPE
jgi:hypothetical protein